MNSINTEKGGEKTTETKNVSTQLQWCHPVVLKTQLYNLTGKGDVNSQRSVHVNTHEISENAGTFLMWFLIEFLFLIGYSMLHFVGHCK